MQEVKWARHGNMRNVVLVWIAQSNFYYKMPPKAANDQNRLKNLNFPPGGAKLTV